MPSATESESTIVFSPKHILVPVDGSENAKRALKVAADIGRKYGSDLIVLNVTTTHAFTAGASTGAGSPNNIGEEQKARQMVENSVKLAHQGAWQMPEVRWCGRQTSELQDRSSKMLRRKN